MFTRISKVVLWILVVGIVIGGFVCLGIDPAISLIVWLGGLIFIYGFGIFVELINNVLDIKKILNKMYDNGYSMGTPIQSQYNPGNPGQYVQNGNTMSAFAFG